MGVLEGGGRALWKAGVSEVRERHVFALRTGRNQEGRPGSCFCELSGISQGSPNKQTQVVNFMCQCDGREGAQVFG